MIGRALDRGVKDATRRPGLVALLWGWNLALAAVVALPFWAWIHGASSASPVTDALLDGLDVGVIASLIAADPGAARTLLAAAAAIACLSMVSGAFLSGGLLEVVTSTGDERALAHRFFRGAGHFFGRFSRLLVIAGLTALPVLGIVGAALGAAASPLSSSGSEPAALWATLLVQGGLGLALAWLMLALDYARVATVLSGSRSMLRTWLRSLALVMRRAPAVALIGVLSAIGVAAAFAVTAAYDVSASGRTWGAIVGAVLVHQSMLVARTAVRVGQVSAQAQYWRDRQPVVAFEAAPVDAAAPAPEPGLDVSVQSPARTGDGNVERG